MLMIDLATLGIIRVNRAACDLLGYSESELLTLTLPSLMCSPDVKDLSTRLQGILSNAGRSASRDFPSVEVKPVYGGEGSARIISPDPLEYHQEQRCLRKDGTEVWIKLKITVLQSAGERNGLIQGLCVAEDITESYLSKATLSISEKRFKRLFDSNIVGMVFLRLSGEIIDANDLFLYMLGYTRQELEQGLIRWDEITPPEYAELDRQVIETAQRTGVGLPWEKEYFRKDGSRIPVLVGGGLIEGLENEGIAFVIDITKQQAAQTERNRAEEQLRASLRDKEMLLKEIHHRVKNSMQMVSSLLSLQAGSIQDPQILQPLKDSQNRVKVMALIHEKLYQSASLSNVSFTSYIQVLAKDLLRSYSLAAAQIELCCELDEIEMDIDMLMPCGLIVNELVSNAIKYAFPDLEIAADSYAMVPESMPLVLDVCATSQQAQIQVRFFQDQQGDCTLCVADNGVGLPEAVDVNNTSSLGLQLVCALTAKLRGTLTVTQNRGTQFSVKFPGLTAQATPPAA
jgi:PAS domain S-box-containing protein